MIDQDTQNQIDQAVAQITAKFDAEKQAAVQAIAVEKDGEIASLQNQLAQKDAETGQKVKEGQGEILVSFKSRFGLN